MENNRDVLVIGAGIVGVCCAYYLCEKGFEVTVIDKGEISAGCSKENAGLIVPSLVVPLASPGALSYGLKKLLSPGSPFYIKPRLNIEMISWLLHFLKASRPEKMERGMRILHTLNCKSRSLFDEIIQKEGISCEYQTTGWLKVFLSEHGLHEGLKEAKMLKPHGIEFRLLSRDELLSREPLLSAEVMGGILFPDDGHLDPELFTLALSERLIQKGVVFRPNTQALSFEAGDRYINIVRTNRGDLNATQIVLAAGSWSPGLANNLGKNIPIAAGKGYSLMLKNFADPPKSALYLSEGKVAVTPLSGGLRLAGTMELGGMNENINPRRVDAIWNTAKKYLQIPEGVSAEKPWYGLRPCTPDGVPIIERDRYYNNLITASGHCMLGVTQAPVTGWHVARLASNETPDLILYMLKASRF
jgi:D-amino-acid dehydrogenase